MQQWTHVCLNRPILSGMTRKFTTKLNFGRKKAGKDATAAMDKLRSLEKRQDGWIQEPQMLMFQMTWFLAGKPNSVQVIAGSVTHRIGQLSKSIVRKPRCSRRPKRMSRR